MTTIERDTDDADLPDDRATTARPTFGPTYEIRNRLAGVISPPWPTVFELASPP